MSEKRNRDIKSHRVTDRIKLRVYDDYDKSDESLPTVVTEIIFITGVIDTREKSEEAVRDIMNAFLLGSDICQDKLIMDFDNSKEYMEQTKAKGCN